MLQLQFLQFLFQKLNLLVLKLWVFSVVLYEQLFVALKFFSVDFGDVFKQVRERVG